MKELGITDEDFWDRNPFGERLSDMKVLVEKKSTGEEDVSEDGAALKKIGKNGAKGRNNEDKKEIKWYLCDP